MSHFISLARIKKKKTTEPKSINAKESTPIDFVEKQKTQSEIGAKSEERVFEFEKEFLAKNGQKKLAEKVKIVSDNYALGYDILSFELDGTEKQVEVKTIRKNGKEISFFLTPNELNKSELYPNYYVYCVENPKSDDF